MFFEAEVPDEQRQPRNNRVVKTIMSGQPGTKGLRAKYGHRLICVRYRIYNGKKIKTIELKQ